VAVLTNPASPYTAPFVTESTGIARELGVQLQLAEARDPSEFEAAFATMANKHAGALMVLTDVTFITHRKRIVELAAVSRIPAVYGEREFADAGGLMFYGASLADMYRRAAVYVDKILKGAKPADLPVAEAPVPFGAGNGCGPSVADAQSNTCRGPLMPAACSTMVADRIAYPLFRGKGRSREC